MRSGKRLFMGVLAGLYLLQPCNYGDKTPAEAVKLDSPEVSKLGWKTQSMRAADINGDGRTDLLLLNNEHAKIDILLQQDENGQAKPTDAAYVVFKELSDELKGHMDKLYSIIDSDILGNATLKDKISLDIEKRRIMN